MADRQPYRPAAERKAAIIDATVTLLAEEGPNTITLRRIAERAGVPHPLIIRHFGDKATLIRQATFGELLRWTEVVRDHDDPVAAFVAGFRYLCTHRVSGAAVGLAVSGMARPQFDQDTFPVIDAHVELLTAAGMPQRAALDLAMGGLAMIGSFVAAEDWWLAVGRFRGADARRRARRAMEAQIETLVEAGLARHGANRAE